MGISIQLTLSTIDLTVGFSGSCGKHLLYTDRLAREDARPGP